jgi:protein TonB
MYLLGESTAEDRRHTEECAACRDRISRLATGLSGFRDTIRTWSGRAAEGRFVVLAPAGHLDRLLLPEVPWYRSLWNNLCDLFQPEPSLLDITAKPVLVRDIWGQFGRQRKSWVMSVALQSAVVAILFTVASAKIAPQVVRQISTLVAPADVAEYVSKGVPKDLTMRGGGGGGDRSPLPASKGRLPRAALKQFTPPVAVVQNDNPRLVMEPTIVAPPDSVLPQVNMAQYGDPLARLGSLSNGPGSGGGIGNGRGGGVGNGVGAGVGPGSGGGFGGGVFRIGGGVSAPVLVFKVEPEYSDEARKAKYQGTVLLYVEVDPAGRPTRIQVQRSLGFGLDEKAIEAVRQWRFKPGYKDGHPVTVAATIEVNFRLL